MQIFKYLSDLIYTKTLKVPHFMKKIVHRKFDQTQFINECAKNKFS